GSKDSIWAHARNRVSCTRSSARSTSLQRETANARRLGTVDSIASLREGSALNFPSPSIGLSFGRHEEGQESSLSFWDSDAPPSAPTTVPGRPLDASIPRHPNAADPPLFPTQLRRGRFWNAKRLVRTGALEQHHAKKRPHAKKGRAPATPRERGVT